MEMLPLFVLHCSGKVIGAFLMVRCSIVCLNFEKCGECVQGRREHEDPNRGGAQMPGFNVLGMSYSRNLWVISRNIVMWEWECAKMQTICVKN